MPNFFCFSRNKFIYFMIQTNICMSSHLFFFLFAILSISICYLCLLGKSSVGKSILFKTKPIFKIRKSFITENGFSKSDFPFMWCYAYSVHSSEITSFVWPYSRFKCNSLHLKKKNKINKQFNWKNFASCKYYKLCVEKNAYFFCYALHILKQSVEKV